MTGPALWRIDRPPSTVFLFGETVGVGPGDSWLTDRIRSAIAGCREFWCEVDDPDEIASSPLLAEYGLSDEPLSRRLAPEQLQVLHAVAATLDVDPTTLESFRPWLAGQFLETVHRSLAGIDAMVDVHRELLRLAKDDRTVIRTELPDAKATLSFFADLDRTTETEYLMWTLDRVAGGGTELPRQVASWMAGDGSVVERQLMELRTRYPSLQHALLTDRNRAWVPRIEDMLARAGSCFVLVGDSHLHGEDGLPTLLRARGLPLERV